jgi:hypothetical protein
MNPRILIILPFFLSGCGPAPVGKVATTASPVKNDTTAIIQTDNPDENDETSDSAGQEMATYFVVIADTNLDYHLLHKEMFDLNRKFSIPIDTMGRSYNMIKDLIALPDNDEDEIYAGDYYPRRYPSENLSLEYLDFYQGPAGKKTIALVTGIYETEKGADSALTVLQQADKKAFRIKSKIYVGCMH